MKGQAAPGWYPDPEFRGTFRWWDGVRWTEHRGPMVAPRAPRTPKQRRLRWIIGLVVAAGVVAVGLILADSPGSSPAGTMSAGACVTVVDAAREFAAGSRSEGSFLAVVKGQEGTARTASDLNGKYLPITQAIVSVDTELSAGQLPTASVGFLASQCGR